MPPKPSQKIVTAKDPVRSDGSVWRGEPRYAQIASELMSAIAEGRYPVGEALPTEHELCELFQSSRFTVREALRVLAEAGMVSRRPRAGTIVISAARRQPYVQALDSIEDLLQYSTATRLRPLGRGWVTHQPGQSNPPPIPAGEAWFCARLLRRLPGDDRPVCLTRVYLGPQFAALASRIAQAGQPVYRLIEAEYGVRVARVEQRISACALDREDALALRARPGWPALRIVREYFGDNAQILEVSDSIHPSDRFTYAMTICRSASAVAAGRAPRPAMTEPKTRRHA